jgi:hypothetical protein
VKVLVKSFPVIGHEPSFEIFLLESFLPLGIKTINIGLLNDEPVLIPQKVRFSISPPLLVQCMHLQ